MPQLRAGLSMWGHATIKAEDGTIPVDIWLAEFIRQHLHITALDKFANELTYELQHVAGSVDKSMGFHLAGYTEQDGKKLPTAYHIRNCETQDGKHYTRHEFIAGLDIPPVAIEHGELLHIRNGDYLPFALLSSLSNHALMVLKNEIDRQIPALSLQGRMKYLSAWIRFISELYDSAEDDPIIGGNVSTLMIWPDDHIEYHPVR